MRRVGSLFAGYGGLDLAVEQVLDAELAWVSEIEDAPSRILAHHWPDVPNLGDITQIDWSAVEPVDVLTGGFPCQDVSAAGKRAGLRADTRTGLWSRMAEAIDQLRPRLVVAENVRGLLSAQADSAVEPCPWCVGDGPGSGLRALGAVLGDLADIGYDARWCGLRAADVGAPHGRFRVFVVAWPADTDDLGQQWRRGTRRRRQGSADGGAPTADASGGPEDAVRGVETSQAGIGRLCDNGSGGVGSATDTASHRWHEGRPEPARLERGHDAAERGAAAADADCDGLESIGRVGSVGRDADGRDGAGEAPANADDVVLGKISGSVAGGSPSGQREDTGAGRGSADRGGGATAWGPYEPAIRRWERTLGRVAPPPTEPGRNGNPRLSPRFVEWMQGLPDGWVTGVPGISRNDQLRALGNGVVPQQASEAIRRLLWLPATDQGVAA